MLKRKFGKTGWDVSAVGLGTWNIGNQWGEMDDSTAEAIVRAAFEGGMNLFDVADSYGIPHGLSELRLGKALAGIREQVYIVSKIGHWGSRTGQDVPKTTADMIRLCGHASLGRLRTEWIDVVLCHEGSIKDPSIYIEGFEALREEGFIRGYGISTNELAVVKNFQEVSGGRCAVVELDYSLLNREPEAELLPYCQGQGIGVLVRGPVAMGVLAGKYDAETVFTDTVRSKWNKRQPGRKGYEKKLKALAKVQGALDDGDDLVTTALRYVIAHPCDPVAIPGATSVAQVRANAAAGEAVLDEGKYAALKAM